MLPGFDVIPTDRRTVHPAQVEEIDLSLSISKTRLSDFTGRATDRSFVGEGFSMPSHRSANNPPS